MKPKAYYDGAWYCKEDVRIPLCDRSYFFADAVYEALIGQNGICYRKKDHLCRLYANLRAVGMTHFDKNLLSSVLAQAESFTDGEPFFLYLQISRGGENRRHVFENEATTHLFVSIEPFTLPSPEKRLSLITVNDRRYGFCHIKTTNLLPNVFAAKQAENRGADEAVFIREKAVTECAHSNIFIVKDGVLITHPADCHILPGITRKRILTLAEKIKIPTLQKAFSASELKNADAILVSSTSKLALEADRIDGKKAGGKAEAAKALIEAIFEDFREETDA